MKYIILSIAVLSVACVAANKPSGPKERKTDVTTERILEKLASKEYGDRHGAVRQILTHRIQLVDGLLKVAREAKEANDIDELFDGTKVSAIYLLGELRATEAIKFLVDNISMRAPFVGGDIGENEGLPCVQALVRIGNPAAEMILHSFVARSTKEMLEYYLRVMKGVWGNKVSLFLLNEKLKTEQNAERRATLQAALNDPMFKTVTTEGKE